MDEPRFDPLDYVSVVNRRKWWFIVPLALALIVGGLLVYSLLGLATDALVRSIERKALAWRHG